MLNTEVRKGVFPRSVFFLDLFSAQRHFKWSFSSFGGCFFFTSFCKKALHLPVDSYESTACVPAVFIVIPRAVNQGSGLVQTQAHTAYSL